jgi:hypothetical protein
LADLSERKLVERRERKWVVKKELQSVEPMVEESVDWMASLKGQRKGIHWVANSVEPMGNHSEPKKAEQTDSLKAKKLVVLMERRSVVLRVSSTADWKEQPWGNQKADDLVVTKGRKMEDLSVAQTEGKMVDWKAHWLVD